MFDNEIDEITRIDKPVIIFGTKAMGMLAKKVYDYYHIKVYGFCDNNCEEWGKKKLGINVLNPKELKQLSINVRVDICTMNKEAIESIKNQLKEIGIEDIHTNLYYVYQYIYQTKVIKRNVDIKKFEEAIRKVEILAKEEIGLGLVNVVVTEKCTLKCKHCLSLMPYFNKPIHYEAKTIVHSIRKLANSVAVIRDLFIFGGEPFLYPNLEVICEELSKISNIICLWIITNGTINLKEETLIKLQKNGFNIVCSDYGDLSTKKEQLSEKQEKLKMISGGAEMSEYWYDIGEPVYVERLQEENSRMYRHCIEAEPCFTVINGEFHICSRSAFGTRLGIIPKNKGDYIDLEDKNLESDEIAIQIKGLLNKKSSIEACKYCNVLNPKKIERAIQVKK